MTKAHLWLSGVEEKGNREGLLIGTKFLSWIKKMLSKCLWWWLNEGGRIIFLSHRLTAKQPHLLNTYIWAIHKKVMSKDRSRKLRLILHLELKRKEALSFGTSKGRKTIHKEMENQMFDKQMFAGKSLTMAHRENFDQMVLARFLLICPTLVHI